MARRKYYGKVSQRREHVPGRWEDRNAQTPGKGPCKRELRWVQEERCVSEVQVIGMESKACGREQRATGTERRVLVDTVNPTEAQA